LFFWRKKQPTTPEADTDPTLETPPAAEPTEADAPAEVDVAPSESALAADANGAEPEVAEAQPAPGDDAPDAPIAESADRPAVAASPGAWSASQLASAPRATVYEPPADAIDSSEATGDLRAGLARSRGGFMSRLRGYLGGSADGASWDDVEETLIGGDVGAALAMDVVERARKRRDPDGSEAAVRAELTSLLARRDSSWQPRRPADGGPAVILVVGVNGTGKTTTIGKLAARYRREGQSVILAAADTFRAAAIDQLRIWAERAGVPVVAHAPNADPGAVVFDALDAAVARGTDLVIVDTAGRLHTKSNLMDELSKIRRIVDKRLPGAEPETLFVLDATTGQNGLAQARSFHEAVGLTGIVLTKLDSTAKGGIVFAIEEALGVPVRFVGVGEKAGDLLPFDPDAFVAALFA